MQLVNLLSNNKNITSQNKNYQKKQKCQTIILSNFLGVIYCKRGEGEGGILIFVMVLPQEIKQFRKFWG